MNSLSPENVDGCLLVNELYRIQFECGRNSIFNEMWETRDTLKSELMRICQLCACGTLLEVIKKLIDLCFDETVNFRCRLLITDCDESSMNPTKVQSYTDIYLQVHQFITLIFFNLIGTATNAETNLINSSLGEKVVQSRGTFVHLIRRKIGFTYKQTMIELDVFQMKVFVLFDFSSARGFPVSHRNRNKNYTKSTVAKGYRILSMVTRYPNGERDCDYGVLESDHEKGHKQVIALADKVIDKISKKGNFKKIGLRCDNCAGQNKNKHLKWKDFHFKT